MAVPPLIIDVGLHHGDDTDFYLRKGFGVLAVEADPKHVEHCRERFGEAIRDRRLTIVHAAIAGHAGKIDFYRNLDKDDWSSADVTFGTRANTRYETITVAAVTFQALLEKHAAGRVIHYIKCDIEGADIHVLRDLLRSSVRPKYFSVEAHDMSYLGYMSALGYTAFKLVNQNLLWNIKLPKPPLEGDYVDYAFTSGYNSGPFGEETPGRWLDFESVADLYLSLKRAANVAPEISTGWYDFHGRLQA